MKTTGPGAFLSRGWRASVCVWSLTLVCGCSALHPTVSPPPNLYSLSDAQKTAAPSRSEPSAATSALTLTVGPPHAAAGFDSPRMMYLRHADKLEYFAHNEWIDTPARMLAPLIVAAVESAGVYRAVVSTPSPATGELRLDTEILRLQHEFLSAPSRVRFTLRAYVVESATRRVIGSREFDAVIPSASEDPQGGVMAAHSAVRTVLADLSTFCADVARNRR